jgi:hypothetical protein
MKIGPPALMLALSIYAMPSTAQVSQTTTAVRNAGLCHDLEARGEPSSLGLAYCPSSVMFTATPKPTQPTAQGFDLVDGAVVCSSFDLANYIATQINQARHARQALPPELRRQAVLMNGEDPGAEPKPSDYGCVLVPVGTALTVEPGNYVPVVSGLLPDGHRFKGVTLPTMVGR